jgi:hypothetical protein
MLSLLIRPKRNFDIFGPSLQYLRTIPKQNGFKDLAYFSNRLFVRGRLFKKLYQKDYFKACHIRSNRTFPLILPKERKKNQILN